MCLFFKQCGAECNPGHGILNQRNLHSTTCGIVPLNIKNYINKNFISIGTVQIPFVKNSMAYLTQQVSPNHCCIAQENFLTNAMAYLTHNKISPNHCRIIQVLSLILLNITSLKIQLNITLPGFKPQTLGFSTFSLDSSSLC